LHFHLYHFELFELLELVEVEVKECSRDTIFLNLDFLTIDNVVDTLNEDILGTALLLLLNHLLGLLEHVGKPLNSFHALDKFLLVLLLRSKSGSLLGLLLGSDPQPLGLGRNLGDFSSCFLLCGIDLLDSL